MQKLDFRNARCIWWLLAASALASCSTKSYNFSVDGVSDKFCVPKIGYVAPGVWFVPDDSPDTPQGFSFGGCHRLPTSSRASCALPDEFISADVEPLSVKHNQTWKDLKEAAIYNSVVSDSSAEYAIDAATGALVVSNKKAWPSWFIWKQSDANDGETSLSLRDSDELIASCSAIEDFPRSSGLGKNGDYGCERYTRGPDYALQYRFISRARVPSEEQLKHLETALFTQVDHWRCKAP